MTDENENDGADDAEAQDDNQYGGGDQDVDAVEQTEMREDEEEDGSDDEN